MYIWIIKWFYTKRQKVILFHWCFYSLTITQCFQLNFRHFFLPVLLIGVGVSCEAESIIIKPKLGEWSHVPLASPLSVTVIAKTLAITYQCSLVTITPFPSLFLAKSHFCVVILLMSKLGQRIISKDSYALDRKGTLKRS